jgi:hypothetical protein
MIFILTVTLLIAFIFEGVLRIVLRNRYQFKIIRFGVELFASLLVLLALLYVPGVVNPISSMASRQTLFYAKSLHAGQSFRLGKSKYFRISDTSGYFLYKSLADGNEISLKTTFTMTSNQTTFITETLPKTK